ncbi:MAG TPA: alpha-amylase family glycosyl hydrolase [Streptosporangiaceae bacterium]|nr:alpha-amylase family glycosyl hydrolase [Streptosporangiaceae bacterium]
MAGPVVSFAYYPGVDRLPAGTLVDLCGSWALDGTPSDGAWSRHPMTLAADETGAACFTADVCFGQGTAGASLSWGTWLRLGGGAEVWGVAAEVPDLSSTAQVRTLTVAVPSADGPQRESYRLCWHRTRGAQRYLASPGTAPPGLGFSVWAPDATAVEVVFVRPGGYVADDGYGTDSGQPTIPLNRGSDGTWTAALPAFDRMVGALYMYRVTRPDGSVNWATDMFSRQQSGMGDFDPGGARYDGPVSLLDGRPSSSVVTDPGMVAAYPADPAATAVPAEEFWRDEFDPARPVPDRVEDLVVYELHVGALNPETTAAGTFADALGFLPYLEDLGVNAIELMPMFQFDGSLSWGYGSSQFLAIESAAGGRDALKHFVKTAHQHGIAVIMDVVYNHYTPRADRAAWQYDSTSPQDNCYYWYEGQPGQYPSPDGGYLDNVSSGWAPRYSADQVRALFVSSAMLLFDEFHVDGLRVDQTASIHLYNARHADGAAVPAANIAGRKFLRELCQTVKTFYPAAVLIAEDHSGWDQVTMPAFTGGVGFDATWYVNFYHHLVGETDAGPQWAGLLLNAGRDPDGPLHMSYFAGALAASGDHKVVYESSHDEAGNDPSTERTILTAVNGAPLAGQTRAYAEARCRFACAMTMLSAGTPMFLMGEEVGAQNAYTYNKFNEEKEDLPGLRDSTGAFLWRFYQDIIRFRLGSTVIRSANIDVFHANDDARVIAFRRWDDTGELLVVGSLNNSPFSSPGYLLSYGPLGDWGWRECLNSDGSAYGGENTGNLGATLRAANGQLNVVVPANGVVVFSRTT